VEARFYKKLMGGGGGGVINSVFEILREFIPQKLFYRIF
jgi:hypothetical protein